MGFLHQKVSWMQAIQGLRPGCLWVLLAGQDFDSILTGDDSLRKRPMDRVVIPLRQMGARLMGIENKEFLPITILGKGATLKSIDYHARSQCSGQILLTGLHVCR